MKQSLYAQYLEEREGVFTIEDESGFLTYAILDDTMFVRDAFVAKDSRQTSTARRIWALAISRARCAELQYCVCQVDVRANGAARSLKVILSHGFEPIRAEGSIITLSRRL